MCEKWDDFFEKAPEKCLKNRAKNISVDIRKYIHQTLCHYL
ncbi:hypothetical protein IMCC1989_489 [gamma proteobacterium IMCC1989]|nr:hypothetical protein IMCC1989_489 [gamma proteobacterium IMCC1989]